MLCFFFTLRGIGLRAIKCRLCRYEDFCCGVVLMHTFAISPDGRLELRQNCQTLNLARASRRSVSRDDETWVDEALPGTGRYLAFESGALIILLR